MKTAKKTLCLLILILASSANADEIADVVLAAGRYESGSDATRLRQVEDWVRQSLTNRTLRPKLERAMSTALQQNATFEGQRFICQQLAVIGTETCLPALCALLKSPETVGIACLALANNPSPKADAVLRDAAGRLSGPALVQVVQTLGIRRDKSAVDLLRPLVASDNKSAARAAVVALGNIATESAIATITNIRRENDPELAASVHEALLTAAWQLHGQGRTGKAARLCNEILKSDAPVHVRRGAFETVVHIDRAGATRRILNAIKGRDPVLRRSAMSLAGKLGDDKLSRQLAELTPTLPPDEQVMMIHTLAMRADQPSRGAIERALNNEDATVRIAAITALGRIGDDSTVAKVARLLDANPGPEELRAIELSLTALPLNESVDKAIAAELQRRTNSVRIHLLAALLRRSNPVSVAIFKREALGQNPESVRLAFQGLGRLATDQDLPMLLETLGSIRTEGAREEAESCVLQVLDRMIDKPRASQVVRQFISQQTDPLARASLIKLLVACPDPAALQTVQAHLSDPRPVVRQAAVRTLSDWPDVSAWELLSNLYKETQTGPERVLVLRGLVRLLSEENHKPDREIVDRYRMLLATAATDSDRKLVMGALAGCAHPDALKLAVEQLDHPGVRAEASATLKKIAEAIKTTHPREAQQALQLLRPDH